MRPWFYRQAVNQYGNPYGYLQRAGGVIIKNYRPGYHLTQKHHQAYRQEKHQTRTGWEI